MNTEEIVVIVLISIIAVVWFYLLTKESFRLNLEFNIPFVLILILLGVIFYGLHENKGSLWWIIPTVVILLFLLIIFFLAIYVYRKDNRRRQSSAGEEYNTSMGPRDYKQGRLDEYRTEVLFRELVEEASAYSGMAEAINVVREKTPENITGADRQEVESQLERVKELEREIGIKEGEAFDFVNPNISNDYRAAWLEGKTTRDQRRTEDDVLRAGEQWKLLKTAPAGRSGGVRISEKVPVSEIFVRDEPLTYNTEKGEWSSVQTGTIRGVEDVYLEEKGMFTVVQKPLKGKGGATVYQPREVHDQTGKLLTASDFTYQ